MLIHRPGLSALHKGPDRISRNVEGRDQLLLAKSSEYEYWRDRIKGIATALRDGTAEDEEPTALTVDQVPEEKLKPFPHTKGLAVSLNYERRAHEHKFGGTARGDKGAGKGLADVEAPPPQELSSQSLPASGPSQQEASRVAASQLQGRSAVGEGTARHRDGKKRSEKKRKDEAAESAEELARAAEENIQKDSADLAQIAAEEQDTEVVQAPLDIATWEKGARYP